jgi:hypothetical protein
MELTKLTFMQFPNWVNDLNRCCINWKRKWNSPALFAHFLLRTVTLLTTKCKSVIISLNKKERPARFDVLSATITVFWGVTPCSLTDTYLHLGGTCYCFYPEDGGIYGDIPNFGKGARILPHNCTVRDLLWYADVKNKPSNWSLVSPRFNDFGK